MPKKIPLVSIGVQREGVTMYPEIGKPFDFTAAELADLKKMNDKQKDAKETVVEYVRDPVNEAVPETAAQRTAREAQEARDKQVRDDAERERVRLAGLQGGNAATGGTL